MAEARNGLTPSVRPCVLLAAMGAWGISKCSRRTGKNGELDEDKDEEDEDDVCVGEGDGQVDGEGGIDADEEEKGEDIEGRMSKIGLDLC